MARECWQQHCNAKPADTNIIYRYNVLLSGACNFAHCRPRNVKHVVLGSQTPWWLAATCKSGRVVLHSELQSFCLSRSLFRNLRARS